MKTKITKKESIKYIRRLCFWLYIYLAFSALVGVGYAFATNEGDGIGFLSSAIALLLFLGFEFFFVYKTSKGKRWALICLTVMFILGILENFIVSLMDLGRISIPIIPILVLLFIIRGFKHIKNVK